MKVIGKIFWEKDCGWKIEVKIYVGNKEALEWSDKTIWLLSKPLSSFWGSIDNGYRSMVSENTYQNFETAKRCLSEILDKLQEEVVDVRAKSLHEYVEVRNI